MLFRKYKNIGFDYYKEKLLCLNVPICIYGSKHIGKKSLVTYVWPNVVMTSSVLEIQDIANTYFNHVVCINLSQLKFADIKTLCCLIDKFSSILQVVLISNTRSVSDLVSSRCCMFFIPLPTFDEITKNISPIIEKEVIDIDIKHMKGKCYHDILVELTLLQNGVDPTSLTIEKDTLINELSYNLNTLSHSDIRKTIYRLFLLRVNMSDVVKDVLDRLCKVHELCEFKLWAVSQAAFYEHRIHLGNKDVYHIEAFLFAVKNKFNLI
jgi:replication factor C subunit 3/5